MLETALGFGGEKKKNVCVPVCNIYTHTYMSFSRYTVRLWSISTAIGSGEKTQKSSQ